MAKLNEDEIKIITELLKEGKPIPEEYRWLLFDNKQETELIYAGKTREVDVITDTMSVPLQRVKSFGDIKDDEWHNMLIFGDNLQVLKTLLKWKEQGKLKNPDGSKGVRLIYIDPPFGTGDIYGRGDVGAYSAKLMGAKYLEWLRQRIILLKELLTDDGSFYMRIDYHFGHYMKVLLDEIFGKENFRREAILKRTAGLPKRETKNMEVETEYLIYYVKNSQNFIFNQLWEDRKPEWMPVMTKWNRGGPTGKPIKIEGIIFNPPQGYSWAIGNKVAQEIHKNGRLKIENNKLYVLIDKKCVGSNWTDIPGYVSPPKWGYPTENHEKLLKRVIEMSSKENDIILDAFSGSGTTGAVAEKLMRRWIMIDSSKMAIYTMIKRMLNLKSEIGNKGRALKLKPFAVYNAGLYDMKMLKELPFDEYRKFALELFQCKDEPHTIAGIELDGYWGRDNVMIFRWKNSQKDYEYVMDRGFIDNLHSILGKRISKQFFIIAPAGSVLFLEDYIEKDSIRYYVLRIPYSVIDELHKKNFKLFEQPLSADISEVNKVMEQIGFDFIYPPDVDCKYTIEKQKGQMFEEAVIKIKKFHSNIISKKPISEEELGLKALSMVMIDYDFDGECFDMDAKWFAKEIEQNNYEIRFPAEKLTDKMMIIYMDVWGNERKEIRSTKDFKK